MSSLLMITGDRTLAQGRKGAFYNTLEEFHKYWDRVDIICPKTRGPASPHPHGAQLIFARHGGPPVESPLAFFDNVFIHPSPWPLIFHPLWIMKKGKELFQKHKFDLITVHEYPPFYNGLAARFLWQATKVPYVIEIMHVPGYPQAGNIKEWLYRHLFHWFIKFDTKHARAVRVINQTQVPQILSKAGIASSKIIYIPAFYIDFDVFHPVEMPKMYDALFVGRFERNKGIHLFLEAIKSLKIKAAMVGDGPLLKSLKLKIKNEKLEDRVVFLGWVKDSTQVAQLIKQSRILVMPSLNEGGPRVVLEAMACAVPVLATPVGIVPDVVKDGESGGIIDFNSRDIAQKIKELLENPVRYKEYQKQGLLAVKDFEKRGALRKYAEKLQNFI